MSTPYIYRSDYPTPYVPTNLSVSQLLQLYNPDDVEDEKTIFEDDWTGRKLTYAGIRDESSRGAFGFKNVLGLQEGDIVCICAPNSVDVVKLIHAVLWCGGTAVLVNPLSTAYEVAHYLEVSRPNVLAADSNTWSTLFAAGQKVTGFHELKGVSIDDTQSPLSSAVSLSQLFDQRQSLSPMDLSRRDSRDHTAVVCFSSGTSGKSKAVSLSHHNLVASMLGIRSTDPTFWTATVRGVFFAPLCHIYGLMTVALMGSFLGYFTVLMKKYNLESFLQLSAKINANALRILPTIAVSMTKDHGFDLSRLRNVRFIMCSGAALPPSVIEFLNTKFPNAPIFQGYGMTETNITTLKPETAHRIGSVGKLFANVEARIVDDNMNDVKVGQQGEMLVRGPSVFRGYMNNPDATRETFHDGWMRTGDILRVDEKGFFYLTERKKELIKYKGNQVAPAELEAILNSHPYVNECAVCALWDEDQGTEVPIAYVSLTADGKATGKGMDIVLADIRDHVDEKVSHHKRLRGGVVVLDEIPKSGNGKILRRLLPARLARERKSKL